jgi:hypothetical protein
MAPKANPPIAKTPAKIAMFIIAWPFSLFLVMCLTKPIDQFL